MEKKRLGIAELRQQRQFIRRIAIGAMVVAMVFIVASCQGLTPRDAAALRQQSQTQVSVHGRQMAAIDAPTSSQRLGSRRALEQTGRMAERWL